MKKESEEDFFSESDSDDCDLDYLPNAPKHFDNFS